jgi:hypothetical protein
MKNVIGKLASIALTASLSMGCASYKKPMSHYDPKPLDSNWEIREKAVNNKIYNFVPYKSEQIKWYDIGHWITWSLAGNENDGIFGEWNKKPYTTNINFKGFCSWTSRNPMHNFTFYTIGSAGWKKHHSYNIFAIYKKGVQLFHDDTKEKSKTYFKIGLNDFKPWISLDLPYSRSNKTDFVLGWRPQGSFEIKARIKSKRDN